MIDECFVGDVRDGLRAFIAAGIKAQTCITSPPYWGLRDYGTAQWEGGDAACDHVGSVERLAPPGTAKQASNRETVSVRSGDCDCGARRIDRQIGLEQSPGEYVATMVEVFRFVRDVLADDGTLWLNLGDSYAGNATSGGANQNDGGPAVRVAGVPTKRGDGLKPKDLVGIPWRVAFALQADGWYLRSDIIWHKQNPMPESVTDRPTKAHEYLFLLAKNERYFYDAAAIAEESITCDPRRPYTSQGAKALDGRSVWHSGELRDVDGDEALTKRNRRTVWTVATQPYSGAHFATFPRALVEPCILASSRPGDVVLDPFMGSGTVAQVAQDLGRRWIGCELNPAYVEMQRVRARQRGLELAAAD